MEQNAPEDIKSYLLETNEEFRRLAGQHSAYARELDEIAARAHPSQQEQIEEIRLKKLKLRLKDQMELIMSRYRAQQVH